MKQNTLSPDVYELARLGEIHLYLHGVLTGLDALVERAKLGDLSWSDLQEIKDNIKILEAKVK